MTIPWFLCLGLSLALQLAIMTALWTYSLRLRDASIVDRYWGLGFVVQGGFYLSLTWYATGNVSMRALLAFVLVSIWGLRLGWHIHRRNRGKPEDFRYQEMRAAADPGFKWVSLWRVFWLQGVLNWLIGMPLFLATTGAPELLCWVDFFGAAIWLCGFVFEAVGDAQLRRFKSLATSRGRIMDQGLWSLTRHPNYFGDACVWWGLFVIGAAAAYQAALPWGFLSFICPLLMQFFLMQVSGVAMLEKTMRQRPGYDEYQARVPAFFPRLSNLWTDKTPRS